MLRVLLLTTALLALGAAAAAQDAEVVAALRDDRAYVAPGRDVDVDALRAVAATAGDDVRIASLGDDVDATAAAQRLRSDLGGTVVVLTPTAVGVSSVTYDDAAIDAALERAADRIGTDDAAAAQAVLQELTDPPAPVWPWVVGVALLIVGAVTVVGRLRDRRERLQRAEAAIDADLEALQDRLQAVADRVLNLQPEVAIVDNAALQEEFARATAIYREVQDGYRTATTRPDVARWSGRLGEAEVMLDHIGNRLP